MKQRRTTLRPSKAKPSSTEALFLGHWRIAQMELWDSEAVDLLGPAFIRFEEDRMGGFQFIAVRGGLDCRFGERDGSPLVEFSWEGDDEGDPRCGRGWAILTDDRLEGRLFCHGGDDSSFVATRATETKPRQATRRLPVRKRERA